MNRQFCTLILLLALRLVANASSAHAVSAVFDGDPINPGTGLPYEIAPGAPLVQAGADGLLGTADDVIDPTKIGDLDIMVRSGSPDATADLPAPSIAGGRAAVPVATAGPLAAGGVPLPFTVFLSDGSNDSAAPYGRLLPAADMDGIPVIVVAYGDLDNDGWIGPTDADPNLEHDNMLEVRELEPVGRAVVLLNGGVGRGSMAIRAGRPASEGGLSVVLCALSLTGPYDPAFMNGEVPSGPAITTALPFVAQRDLARMIRDRAILVGPATTVQNLVQFAALPTSSALALPVDGRSPSIDVAVVNSQTAVAATFIEVDKSLPGGSALRSLTLGNHSQANRRRLRVRPADRFGNPADPPSDFSLSFSTSGPLRILRPLAARNGRAMAIDAAAGIDMVVSVQPHSADTNGALLAERNGGIVGALPYHVDDRLSRPRVDVRVPSGRAPTIQAAIDNIADRNRDGQLVIDVAPGIYHENIRITRPTLLRGRNADVTLIQGDGSAPTITVSSANVTTLGITAVGGTDGFAVNAASTELSDSRAWNNNNVGVAVNAGNVTLRRASAIHNGSHGISAVGGSAALYTDLQSIDNGGSGANLASTSQLLIEKSQVADNGASGLTITDVSNSVIEDNSLINNIRSGVLMVSCTANRIANNIISNNDDDGMTMDRNVGNLVTANLCQDNNGYGIYERRGDDDFGAASGTQTPPGDNTATGNRKEDVLIR